MTWILVVISLGGNPIDTFEFSSRHECRIAAAKIEGTRRAKDWLAGRCVVWRPVACVGYRRA